MSTRVILAPSKQQIVPRLLGLLALAEETEFRSNLLLGTLGQWCVEPTAGVGRLFDSDAPQYWVSAELSQRHVTTENGDEIEIAERREGLTALELALAVDKTVAENVGERLGRVVFALKDQQTLGEVARLILVRGPHDLRYAFDAEQPDQRFVFDCPCLLWVTDAPLYVVLKVLDSGVGRVFYEARDSRVHENFSGLYLPWGTQCPLMSALSVHLEEAQIKGDSGRLLPLRLDRFQDLHPNVLPNVELREAGSTSQGSRDFEVKLPLELQPLRRHWTRRRKPPELWLVPESSVGELLRSLHLPESDLDGVDAQVIEVGADRALYLALWNTQSTSSKLVAGLSEQRDVLAFVRGQGELESLLIEEGYGLFPDLRPDSIDRLLKLKEGELSLLAKAEDGTVNVFRLSRQGFTSLRQAGVEYTLAKHEHAIFELRKRASFDFGNPEVAEVQRPEEDGVRQAEDSKGKQREADTPAADTASKSWDPTTGVTVNEPQNGGESLKEPTAPQVDPAPDSPAQTEPAEAQPLTDMDRYRALSERLVLRHSELRSNDWDELRRFAISLRRRTDAQTAAVRMLCASPADSALAARASDWLSEQLVLRTNNSLRNAVGRLVRWAETSEPLGWSELAQHVLSLYLCALRFRRAFSRGAERAAVSNLLGPLREEGDPFLCWLLARASLVLMGNRELLETLRLEAERGLAELKLEHCLPQVMREELKAEQGERVTEQCWASLRQVISNEYARASRGEVLL